MSLSHEVARNHRLAHEDAEFRGDDYESPESYADRRRDERLGDAMIAAAELADGDKPLFSLKRGIFDGKDVE